MADDIGTFGFYAAIATFTSMSLRLIYLKYTNNETFFNIDFLSSLL